MLALMDRSSHGAVVMLAMNFSVKFDQHCDNFLASSVRFDHSFVRDFRGQGEEIAWFIKQIDRQGIDSTLVIVDASWLSDL